MLAAPACQVPPWQCPAPRGRPAPWHPAPSACRRVCCWSSLVLGIIHTRLMRTTSARVRALSLRKDLWNFLCLCHLQKAPMQLDPSPCQLCNLMLTPAATIRSQQRLLPGPTQCGLRQLDVELPTPVPVRGHKASPQLPLAARSPPLCGLWQLNVKLPIPTWAPTASHTGGAKHLSLKAQLTVSVDLFDLGGLHAFVPAACKGSWGAHLNR